MREKRWYPVLYMFAVTALFSSIVIGFTQITRTRVQANEALAFERAVVTVFPQLDQTRMSSLQIHSAFTDQVTEPDETSGGAYTLKQEGRVVGYALPIAGQGFWAPIKGIIGVDADRNTVTGIVLYEQNETPGLGAEIAKAPFQDQFKDKKLGSDEKLIRFKRPGEDLGPSDVHAVTGATQTSTRLERIINASLNAWHSQVGERGGAR